MYDVASCPLFVRVLIPFTSISHFAVWAADINKSLTFLEQVVIALSSKNREHIPFRQSKLTNVLRDSLGGNCMTRLIANVWGALRCALL